MSPPARIASSSSDTSDLVRVTGNSLQLSLVGKPKIPGGPTSVVDGPGFYTTRWDVNELTACWAKATDGEEPGTIEPLQ